MNPAEIIASPILRRPVAQLAILTHIGEMEDRTERGHDARPETTALRIREQLGIARGSMYNSLYPLIDDRLVRKGEPVRVRYRYTAPCHELTPEGRRWYEAIRGWRA